MSESKRALTRRALLGGTALVGAGAVLGAGTSAAAGTVPAGRPLDQKAIDTVAGRLDHSLIALRRRLHRHPELAGAERHTAATVAGRLRSAGLTVTTGVGGYGVVGILDGAHPGRTVAYRADMDAVPADSQSPAGTKAAHVCGHDVHTTVGVGIAEVLARLRHRLSGRLVLFFQPAEETLAGARAMIAEGVLERTKPAEIHAVHCGLFPVGQFGIMPGSGVPGLDQGVLSVPGPDAAERAQRLAAEIGGLGTVAVPRTPADLERLVHDLQIPDGPLARFVFLHAGAGEPDTAGRVTVEVSFRCWPEARYVEVRDNIRRLAEPYAGTSVSFPTEPFPAMVSSRPQSEALGRHLRRALGPEAVAVAHAAFPFAGEDYAFFLQRVPGTFSFLGVRAPGAGIDTSFPHFGAFDPDERAIGVGVRGMAGWLAHRLRP